MRILRTLVAVVTAALLGVALLAAPAQADHGWTVDDRLKSNFASPYKNRLKGKVYHQAADGSVDRLYKRKVVKIQKKTCKRCKWRTVKKDRTNRKARFAVTVRASRNCRKNWRYRAKVSKRRGMPASTGRVYKVGLTC